MRNSFGNDNREQRNNNENDRNKNERNVRDNNKDNDSTRGDTDKDKVLVGIFETEDEVINVINRLKETGYQEDDITLVAKDKKQMEHIDDETDVDTKSNSMGDKVGAGAAVGGVLGGVAAALPALGLLLIPGIGPILAAGPIAVILGGVITGGVTGGLVGGLIQLGVREEDAKEYEELIDQGNILVLVENRENMREDVNASYRQNNSILTERSLQR